MREQIEGLTFANFAAVAKRMRWTADELASEFRGVAEKEPASSFCSRVLRGDPDWSVVIPFPIRDCQIPESGGRVAS